MTPPARPRTRHDQLKSDFETFDKKNPQVYAAFEKRALALLKSGHAQISAGMLLHLIRSDPKILTDSNRTKISQNHSPFYAQKFLAQNPASRGAFKMQKQPSRDRPPRVSRVRKDPEDQLTA